jgi:hypothetical protein
MNNIMAFNDHNSGFFHSMPVMTQNTPATDSIIMFSGYTSRLVNTTPTTVIILASHPISLLCFVKINKNKSFFIIIHSNLLIVNIFNYF